MILKRRQKEEISLIKRRSLPENKEVKIKKRKPESKETNIPIKRRNHELVNKKKQCNKHSESKIIYTKLECPLCDANKLIHNLTNTIDSQRNIIKKGFDEVYRKLFWEKESTKSNDKKNIDDGGISLKRKRRRK